MTLEEIQELSKLRLQSEQRLQVENRRLRAALEEIGRLATEEGAHHFAKRASEALAGTR